MFNVLVDDVRDAGNVGVKDLVIIRDPRVAVAVLIKLHGHIGTLFMDNDMGTRDFAVEGPGPEWPEGHHILDEYLHYCDGQCSWVPRVVLVTANCVAEQAMKMTLERYGYVSEDDNPKIWIK